MTWTENPGSDAAIERGCTCAVLDNNHGKYPPWPGDGQGGLYQGWWITDGCPVHDAPNGGSASMNDVDGTR